MKYSENRAAIQDYFSSVTLINQIIEKVALEIEEKMVQEWWKAELVATIKNQGRA